MRKGEKSALSKYTLIIYFCAFAISNRNINSIMNFSRQHRKDIDQQPGNRTFYILNRNVGCLIYLEKSLLKIVQNFYSNILRTKIHSEEASIETIKLTK